MPETYTVQLPLPPPEASPNTRAHRQRKAAAIRHYRECCGLLVRLAGVPAMRLPVRVDLEFFCGPGNRLERLYGVYRPKDEDNARASAKQIQDALKDAGVVPDDDAKNVRVGRTRIYRTPTEHEGRACVVVTLESEGGEP